VLAHADRAVSLVVLAFASIGPDDDRTRALVHVALRLSAIRDRTVTLLVMELEMTVMVRQTVQALAPVFAGTDGADRNSVRL